MEYGGVINVVSWLVYNVLEIIANSGPFSLQSKSWFVNSCTEVQRRKSQLQEQCL